VAVHAKDARLAVMAGVIADDGPTEEIWRREAFCPLGAGDVDIPGVVRVLHDTGFAGWLVVEQDIMPTTAERFAQAAADQRANREYLRSLGV
jgi:inosose dehydratase